ncbi:MAG: RNA-binding protein [Hyphomicrobiaceae bacterium]
MGPATRADDQPDERADTPERTCIVTRRVASPDELIRFVVGPDGTIVPDVAGRLPGRGVWVTCEKAVVAKAVQSKAFTRSFRRAVTVAEDLPEQVDRLLERRVIDALSLANKAGLVTAGFTRAEAAIVSGEAAMLVQARDAAADGTGKLERLYRAVSREAGTPPVVVRSLDVMQMSLAIGRSNVVHAALNSGGTAERFAREARRLERLRNLPTDVMGSGSPEAEGPTEQAQVGPTGNE